MSRSRALTWAVLALLAVAPSHSAIAEDGRRVALVVANASYPSAPLQNPTVDADLLEPVLKRMGFTVTVVKDADLQTFALALESFYAEAKAADLALFYFAGHGFAVNGQLGAENYLMSTSADVTSGLDVVIRSGGLSLDEIVASIASAARVSLVFVDACRNDPRVSRGGRAGRGLARIADVGTGETFVGLSTRLGDLAEDGEPGGGSPFARAFAANMPTPDLPIDEAFRKLRLAVVDETDGRQRPEARDDLNTPIVLLNAEGSAAPTDFPPPAVANVPAPDNSATSNPPLADSPPQPPSQEVAVALPDQAGPGPAQRAIYYFQGTGDQPGSAAEGSVTWAKISKDSQPAVRATIVIPKRDNATVTITISKNRDTTLPASHLVELQFSGTLSDAAIDKVPALVLKPTELDHGKPLAGAAVRVAGDFFWIALSEETEDLAHNEQLMRDGIWFDVHILFSDQARGMITFEKGEAGQSIFETVLGAWAPPKQ